MVFGNKLSRYRPSSAWPAVQEDSSYVAASNIIASMTAAIEIVDDQLHPIQDQILTRESRADEVLTALIHQLRSMSSNEVGTTSDSLAETSSFEATQDIFLVAELDGIDHELAELEAKRETDDMWGDRPDMYQIDPEIFQRDQEEIDTLNAFGECKRRQEELRACSRNNDEDQELCLLGVRIQELGHHLALLGVPIRDNSIVLSEARGSDDGLTQSEQYDESELDEIPEESRTTQVGLFDGLNIEKPNASMDGEAEVHLTRAELASIISKLHTKILNWMESTEGEHEDLQNDEALSVGELGDSLDVLAEVGLQDSITRILAPSRFTRREKAILESRSRAWAVQLSRDRKETAMRIEVESPDIELPSGFQEWLV